MFRRRLWIWVSIFFFAIAATFVSGCNSHPQHHKPSQSPQPSKSSNNQKHHTKSSNKGKNQTNHHLVWGIDTASKITDSFYKCVVTHYGKPKVAARYMEGKQGYYSSISKNEVKLLHHKGIKVLPIYNKLNDATSLNHGKQIAQQAIRKANTLGIPKGTFITADIEPSYPVDSQFIIGWTKSIIKGGYKPGIYGNYQTNLKNAYRSASNQSSTVHNHLLIWSNTPKLGITGKHNAPNQFKASSPNKDQTFVWQYGLNGKQCNIDSDLIKSQILNNLW